MYVTLRCLNCEKESCDISRKYIDAESKEGCTRCVSDELAAKYTHFTKEIGYMSSSIYQEAMTCFEQVYSCPIGRKIGSNGKVLLGEVMSS